MVARFRALGVWFRIFASALAFHLGIVGIAASDLLVFATWQSPFFGLMQQPGHTSRS